MLHMHAAHAVRVIVCIRKLVVFRSLPTALVAMQYSRTDDKYTFKDVFSSHFEAHTTNTPCSNAPVTLIHTVDTVLLPCPIPYLFSPDSQYGCASMASILPSFFSTLAYKKQSGTILDNTKHPNFASNGGPGGLTLFLPTAASITNSGVGQESFIRIDNALDHIISAHVIRGQYCIGGGGDVSQSFWAGRWNGANGERAAERSVSGTVATVQAGLSLGSSAVVAADVESGQAPSMAPLSMGQPVAAAPENPTAQAPVGDTEVIVTEEPAEVIVTEEPDAVTPPVGDPGGVSQPEGTPEGDPGEVTTGGLPGGEPEGEPVVQKEDGARTRAPRGSVTATPEAQVAGISDTPEDGTNSFASSGASSIADIGTINPVEPATDSALFEESTAFEQLARRLLARRLQDLGAVTAAAGPAAAAREVEEPEQGVAAPAPASSPAVVASEPWSAITLLNPGFCAPSATIKVKEGTGDFPASATISSPNGATALTTSRINIRVCGGYVHEIDRVLMPCSYAVYQAASDEERDGQDAQVASTPVDSSAGGSVNRRGWGLLCASATLLGVSWLLPP